MDNLSKYLEDISFIGWVFNPSPQNDLIWNQYEIQHPDEIKNIRQAKNIILQFRTIAKTLSEEEKILLFSRVLKDIEQKQKKNTTLRIFTEVFKYAAIAIIFFSIGALLFYRDNPVNPAFYSLNSDNVIPENRAQLIRSDGKNIILDQKRTVLKYRNTGELVIDNDTLKPIKADSKTRLALNQLIIPFGKTSEVMLPDGTKVFLNAGSRLVYPDLFVGDTREVYLNGEAYFEVKHNDKQPFIVQVNDLRIKDLGTKFNISAYSSDGRVETVLTEGKVNIRQNNSGFFAHDTELIPGQLASFSKQSGEISVKTVNVDDYILWTQEMMKFETVDLNRIIKKLERYYNIHFEYKDPMLGTVLISGKLELKEGKKEVLERIARTASVKITEKENGIYEILK
jgi:hypothetical protein